MVRVIRNATINVYVGSTYSSAVLTNTNNVDTCSGTPRMYAPQLLSTSDRAYMETTPNKLATFLGIPASDIIEITGNFSATVLNKRSGTCTTTGALVAGKVDAVWENSSGTTTIASATEGYGVYYFLSNPVLYQSSTSGRSTSDRIGFDFYYQQSTDYPVYMEVSYYSLYISYYKDITCTLTVGEISASNVSYPQNVTFSISASCSDSACGTVSYSGSSGGVSSSLDSLTVSAQYIASLFGDNPKGSDQSLTCNYTVSGCSSSSVSKTKTITAYKMTSGGTVDGNNISSYSETPYIKTSGTSTSMTLVYSNSWGPYGGIDIYVDGNLVTTGSNKVSSRTYTLNFTSSAQHTITYKYNGAVEYTYYVKAIGIIPSTGVISVNGTEITASSNNPVVAAYNLNTLVLNGMGDSLDSNATYTWSMSSPVSQSDYVLSQDSVSPMTAYLTCNNTASTYIPVCSVTSYGTTRNFTFPSGKYITCRAMTVAVINSITPSEAETGDPITAVGESIRPYSGGSETAGYSWAVLDQYSNPLPSGSYTVISGQTSSTFVFSMNITGVFVVKLTSTTSVTGYEQGTDTDSITINDIVDVSQPVQSRYSVILYNDTYTSVINRANSNVLFMDLNFSSGLNSIGKCSFQIVGGNNLSCGGVSSSESLLTTGTKVLVVDNMCPVWIGKISSVNNVNINYYQSYTTTSVLNIECEEIIKELSYQYISPENAKTVSGKLEDIVKNYIIPSMNHGAFGVSTIQYAVSLSTSSRLTALDQLSSQVGWRYRVRPNVTAFCNQISISSGTVTVSDSSKLSVGDILIIYDNEDDLDGAGFYHSCVVSTISSGNHITISRLSNPLDDGTYYFTNYRGFLVDYRPAYYQDYVPLELDINDCAQNVDSIATAADKFGEVSVFCVGNSGETISSNMRAWMQINPNYTIDNTARVSIAYDSTVDTINTLGDVVDSGGYTWTKFAITLNGWSFPSIPAQSPTIFYKNEDNDVFQMRLRTVSGNWDAGSIIKFVDQSSTQKTQIVVAFVAYKNGADVPVGDQYYQYYKDSEGRKYVDIISSMPALTNVVFNYLTVESDKVLNTILPGAGNEIMIGDTKVIVRSTIHAVKTEQIVFDWILTDGQGNPVKVAPHGHLTDVLVIDNTGTKHNNHGYKYSNADPDSPYGKYSDVTISIQGSEGYSRMELERLACRYMQYGSNYSDRGSCRVVLNAFVKSDYDIGCKKILTPGDRFVLNKVTGSSGSSTISESLNFELLSYNVSLNSNTVTVSFGMPFIEIGDIIYNMMSNSGMSIMSSSSDTNV